MRTGGVAWTVVGCLLILASAPVFLWLVPSFKGLAAWPPASSPSPCSSWASFWPAAGWACSAGAYLGGWNV